MSFAYYIHTNEPSWLDNNPETPWYIDRIFNGNYQGNSYPNSNVNVAILDSGIDSSHPELNGQVTWSYDATGGNNVTDATGHGTQVAGVIGAKENGQGIVGVNPNANLYSIKVLSGPDNVGDWDWLSNGIYAAVRGPDGIVGTADDANVISMSLESNGEMPPPSVHDAITYAYNHNVALVAAAGNSGDNNPSTNEITWPAAYPEVIAVGATYANDSITSFSDSAPYIELVAPGYNIPSTYLNGGYVIGSGTSLAAPQVAGIISLLISQYGHLPIGTFNDMNTLTIRGLLHSSAFDLGPTGYDNAYGYGLVQFN
ncbi:MAG: S8 family serine peptidase [Candidatus Thorarchaeota archaeon]